VLGSVLARHQGLRALLTEVRSASVQAAAAISVWRAAAAAASLAAVRPATSSQQRPRAHTAAALAAVDSAAAAGSSALDEQAMFGESAPFFLTAGSFRCASASASATAGASATAAAGQRKSSWCTTAELPQQAPARQPAFMWCELNYLVKMSTDLAFLDALPLVSELLQFTVADSPLLLPPHSSVTDTTTTTAAAIDVYDSQRSSRCGSGADYRTAHQQHKDMYQLLLETELAAHPLVLPLTHQQLHAAQAAAATIALEVAATNADTGADTGDDWWQWQPADVARAELLRSTLPSREQREARLQALLPRDSATAAAALARSLECSVRAPLQQQRRCRTSSGSSQVRRTASAQQQQQEQQQQWQRGQKRPGTYSCGDEHTATASAIGITAATAAASDDAFFRRASSFLLGDYAEAVPSSTTGRFDGFDAVDTEADTAAAVAVAPVTPWCSNSSISEQVCTLRPRSRQVSAAVQHRLLHSTVGHSVMADAAVAATAAAVNCSAVHSSGGASAQAWRNAVPLTAHNLSNSHYTDASNDSSSSSSGRVSSSAEIAAVVRIQALCRGCAARATLRRHAVATAAAAATLQRVERGRAGRAAAAAARKRAAVAKRAAAASAAAEAAAARSIQRFVKGALWVRLLKRRAEQARLHSKQAAGTPRFAATTATTTIDTVRACVLLTLRLLMLAR
jgi:trimeric autotransporter adhesin